MIRYMAFIFFILISCNAGNSRSKEKATDAKEIKKQIPSDTLQSSNKDLTSTVDNDSITRKPIPLVKKKKSYTRYGTSPVFENYCGEPLLEQIELRKKVFEKSSDTVITYLKKLYNVYEPGFPKYFTYCDPKSSEKYTGPVLNFSVELFEDEFAPKPYLVICFSLKKQKNGEFIIE
jgi:hypothetical protein